jgi:hypothetical protein
MSSNSGTALRRRAEKKAANKKIDDDKDRVSRLNRMIQHRGERYDDEVHAD